jgi:hypothetical protein
MRVCARVRVCAGSCCRFAVTGWWCRCLCHSVIVHVLRVRSISWFPEAWVYFCIGMLLALIEGVADSPKLSRISLQLHESFAELFFVMLLPPIIFESGYVSWAHRW